MGWLARIVLAWSRGSPLFVRSHQTKHDKRMLPANPLVDEGQRSVLPPEMGKRRPPAGPSAPSPARHPVEYPPLIYVVRMSNGAIWFLGNLEDTPAVRTFEKVWRKP